MLLLLWLLKEFRVLMCVQVVWAVVVCVLVLVVCFLMLQVMQVLWLRNVSLECDNPSSDRARRAAKS